MGKTIDVEIYGQRYSVYGDADEAYMRRLAQFVDNQMKTVAENMKTATPSRLAVLTAFNIAHELFEAEKRRQRVEEDVDKRTVSLMESIDQQIRSTLCG